MVGVCLCGLLWARPADAQTFLEVPVPEIFRPPGGQMFFATPVNLSEFGFVEEEFFLEGRARPYQPGPGDRAAPRPSFPYKTRIVVRRPADPGRFNGTVLLEWLNVTVGFDIDIDWIQARDLILREGYAWIGVSAQRLGIHRAGTGLRAWNPHRYGSLDVTADSTLLDDELSYDIFAQAAAAIRNDPGTILGPLVPEVVIATGHSQSANRLSTYYNHVQSLTQVIDGFMIHGGGGSMDSDVGTKAFKVNAETDLWAMRQAARRQPDSDALRTWEVAGSSHADEYYMSHLAELQRRDFGSALTFQCSRPPNSRIPFRYALNAAYEHLDAWVRDGTPPPYAPPIELATMEPEVTAVRDSLGNAVGGVRLPDHDVPTATNSGLNDGQRFCNFFGAHEPFDPEVLSQLYPTRKIFAARYAEAVRRALDAGYILDADAQGMLEAAGRLPSLGGN